MKTAPSSHPSRPTASLARLGDAVAPPPKPATTGVRLMAALPWRAAAKLLLSGVVVVGLAWLGARNAASGAPPATEQQAAAPSAQTVEAPSTAGSGNAGHSGGASPASSQGDAPRGILPDGRVVLNLATEQELRTLPGIGASRATQIVALRTRLGRFRSPRDLLRVRGIGVKMLRRIEPKVVVDPPSPPADNTV